MTSAVETTLEAMKDTIMQCLAAGFVDLESGALVKVHSSGTRNDELLERAAASAERLFLDMETIPFEPVSDATDRSPEAYPRSQELVVVSDERFYVFQRGGPHDNLVLVVICEISANMAMVIARTREAFRADWRVELEGLAW